MGKEKGYRSMGELVKALYDAEQGLARGELGLERLGAACADAQELYERLVVLRHKAREAAVGPTPAVAEPAMAPIVPPVPSPSTAAESIRLDTRPPEVSPRQTSLIEAIEATEDIDGDGDAEKPPPVVVSAPAPVSARSPVSKLPPTLAEKLEKAAILDLSKAISLSHKFWFVAELFNGDRITYDKTIVALNKFSDKEAAMAFLQSEVLAKLNKPADPEALTKFTELLQRRFT